METLYNGIELPEEWPPRRVEQTLDKPLDVPYLERKPETIDIAVGRQLFVDDFLIASTDLDRAWFQPVPAESPLLQPVTALEMNDGYCTCAAPFSGGVFFDPVDRRYKMWYQAGWFDGTAYAESDDGFAWHRLSEIDPSRPGDRVIPRIPGFMRDGDAVWLDAEADDSSTRYKMMTFYRCFDEDYRYYHLKPHHAHDDPTSVAPVERTVMRASSDGVTWRDICEATHTGDNTTFFFNPFRKKWVFSLRSFSKLDCRVRTRSYVEADDLFEGSSWKPGDEVFWARADIFDKPDEDLGYYTQLYNLDAVGYESVMLGVYSILMGPPNSIAGKTGLPKINDIKVAFSRDGFHFSRGSYGDFLASSRQKGSWDYGYLHPANGICTVHEDELRFYYTAFSGQSPHFGMHKYSGGAVGVAKLRRDGFAAMAVPEGRRHGSLLTEPLSYQGCHLFVNADCSQGALRVEVCDREGVPIAGYDASLCREIGVDATKREITWEHNEVLPTCDDAIRLRFELSGAARLYAFWIADDVDGKSRGYLGAGSPDSGNGIWDI